MSSRAVIHPLASPWGRFSLYSYFIDGPEPAIVDTGIASSPVEGMAPALAALGRHIEDVRWIFLTHGHIDHVGGAHALWELTGRRAEIVIHEADAHYLRARRAHVENYLRLRARYLNDSDGEAQQTAQANAAISGECEPTLTVAGGEVFTLGDDVEVAVHSIGGHTAGSLAYAVNGNDAVFVGDAVQIHGGANGFPGYERPADYRRSLKFLRDELQPRRMFLGHPYRDQDGQPQPLELGTDAAQRALDQSLALEQRIVRATQLLSDPTGEDDSVYAPYGAVAAALDYDGDPRLEPSPFFTTIHAYLTDPADQ